LEDEGPEGVFEAVTKLAAADRVLGDPFDLVGVGEAPLDEAGGVVEHALAPVVEGFVAPGGVVGVNGSHDGGLTDADLWGL
jgi:hypothetical protein